MKTLLVVNDEREAQMISGALLAHGITTQIVGAKEYTSHVMGGGTGHYRLLVDPEQEDDARAALREIQLRAQGTEALLPPNYFRRAVILAVAAAVVLPIVFNMASLWSARSYWRHSERDTLSVARLILLIVLQAPGFYLAYFLINVASH